MAFESFPGVTENSTRKGGNLCFWCDLYVLRRIGYFRIKVHLVRGGWINIPAISSYTCNLGKESIYDKIIIVFFLTYETIYIYTNYIISWKSWTCPGLESHHLDKNNNIKKWYLIIWKNKMKTITNHYLPWYICLGWKIND